MPIWPHSRSYSTLALTFLCLFAFRLVNAYFVQTAFQPDEYFQALEPAWQLAFGDNSGAWLTWEWRERLRTSVHPLLFAAAYRVAAWLSRRFSPSTKAEALLAAPRILQAFFAAALDFMTWRIGGRISSSPAAVLFLTLSSPWQWFVSTRTFSNSLEATLTAASLYLFPWEWYLRPEKDDKQPPNVAALETIKLEDFNLKTLRYVIAITPSGLLPALAAAAMAFYIRPTNIIIWMAISAGLVGSNRNYRKAGLLVLSAALMGGGVVASFAVVDHWYYGEWTFPPFRFLYLNLVQSLAVFYGSNRVDYYFTEGLPLLLTTALPFAVTGLWQNLRSDHVQSPTEYVRRQTRFIFALATITTVMAFSAIAHKEMRFVYPILPMLLVLASDPLATFFHPFPIARSKLRQLLFAFMITTNMYIAGYLSTQHQRGVVDVMHFLRHRQEIRFDLADRTNVTAAFLMPCHSTPWRSHLVYSETEAWALTCEPPIDLTAAERESYLDEADVFYNNPAAWLQTNMRGMETISTDHVDAVIDGEGGRAWPQYLVFFDQLEATLKSVLANSRYRECRRFFNTHWHDDWRRKGDVVVWCMRWPW